MSMIGAISRTLTEALGQRLAYSRQPALRSPSSMCS